MITTWCIYQDCSDAGIDLDQIVGQLLFDLLWK